MSANGMVRPCSCPASDESGKGLQRQGARHVPELNSAVAVIGIDIGKNSFRVVGLDNRGAIVLRQKWSRGQVEARSQHAAVPNRHGSLRWCASSQSEAEGIGSRRSADASEVGAGRGHSTGAAVLAR